MGTGRIPLNPDVKASIYDIYPGQDQIPTTYRACRFCPVAITKVLEVRLIGSCMVPILQAVSESPIFPQENADPNSE